MGTEHKQVTVSTAGCCLAIITAQQLATQRDGYGLLFGTLAKEDVKVVNDRGSRTIGKTMIQIQAFSQLAVFKHDDSVDASCISETEQKLNAVHFPPAC